MRKSIGKLGLIALAAVLVLVGCSKPAQAPARSADDGAIGGTIMVWLDNDDWANAVIPAFIAKYPGVTVNWENVGNTDSRGKVSLDGPAGIGPDVFFMPHDHIGNAYLDGIMLAIPADKQREYSGFILDAAMKTCTFNGTLYAVPITTENIALFYNKDLLGSTPVPTTFEQIIEFAKTYNNPAQNKWAMRWGVDDAYHNYHFLTAFGMRVFGPNMDDYHQPGFDSSAAAQGMAFHSSLRDLVFNVPTDDTGWDDTIAAFQRGEVPFTITGPWAIGDAKNNGINFGVTKLPTINGVQPRCFSGNIIGAVSSYSKNTPAALAFLDFVASVEGEQILFDVNGKLPAYKDISHIRGLATDPYLSGIMEQAPFADPMPSIPEVAQMWDPLKDLFTFTWNKQLTVEQAQAKAMEDYDLSLLMAGKSR